MPAESLNPAQAQAVRVQGHCLITAPPGSGKTKVLEHRAAFLLNADPRNIVLGVTFTADAAAELEKRARTLVPNAGARLICGTFHSLCKRQLQNAGQRFVLVSELQQNELMRRAYQDVVVAGAGDEAAVTFEQATHFINHMKTHVEPMVGRSPHELLMLEIYQRYQTLLEQMGAKDFADLLICAVRGMKSSMKDAVAAYPATHLLVDECQDSDEIQYAWVKEHARRGAHVTIVGDDDQSIYSWRFGLGFRGLENFRREHSAAHVALNITYRCAREILTPAIRLIVNNPERVSKTIQTANRDAGQALLKACADPEQELVAMISAIRTSGRPGDWGVLARNNDRLDDVEQALKTAKIPYLRSGGISFWDMKGPALFLGVCESLSAGHLLGIDELMRKCQVGEDQIARIHKACDSRAKGAVGRFAAGTGETGLVGTLQARVRDWRNIMRTEQQQLAFNGIADFIGQHVKFGEKDNAKEVRDREMGAIRRCVDTIVKLRGPLHGRLQFLRDGDRSGNDGEVASKDVTRIMTLHASKGLEFRHVWMVGCEQGVIPSSKAVSIDEERRLFYVGMTRAKQTLFVSYPLARKNRESAPSMFIAETGL